ncbi:hypothetical protein [Pseudomonas sp. NFACC13-1]|uniref:hypothetical protein n=1 Tax=Pseudomonas sp. NFACC13-1 TaxID=1566245 RepID=UPI00088FDFCE|nr:hypothetical protein [Pseudomonas sp. NFACC13-1]SDB32915.1 hypothetical protein SAMN03159290_02407 [Pseudomonas sp. NFACC13-1]
MSLQLPDVVETYFNISNGGDVSQLASCFCPQATVFDENQTHEGILSHLFTLEGDRIGALEITPC